MIKNKNAQMVFIGAIFLLSAVIIFFLSLPVIMEFISYGISQTTNTFAKFIMVLLPIFLFIMILWGALKIMRSE